MLLSTGSYLISSHRHFKLFDELDFSVSERYWYEFE